MGKKTGPRSDAPTINSDAEPDNKRKDNQLGVIADWPEDTQLTHDQHGAILGITRQKSAKVKKLLSEAIAHEMPRALLRVNAYPSKTERPDLFLNILYDAAVRLKFADIANRLLDESMYASHMATIVRFSIIILNIYSNLSPSDKPIKRMSTLRGPMYEASRDIVWEGYGLKALEDDETALKMAVTELLSDNRFISPGKLGPVCHVPFIVVVAYKSWH